MGLTWIDIAIFGAGAVFLLLWLILFFYARRYDEMFESLEEKDFPLCQLYSMGYGFWELTGYKYKGKKDRKLRQEVEIFFGKKYAEFYLRVIYAQKVSIGMLVFMLAFVVYGFSGDVMSFAVTLMLAGAVYYYYGTQLTQKIEKRSEEMQGDFTEVLSKIALLTNAGMILREAWETAAEGNDGVFYQEMRNTLEDMENGMSDAEAIRQFGIRCMVPEVKKFASTVIQGQQKGNRELSHMLQEQSREVWNSRKQRVKQQAEKAASKLIMPMMIMLIGILIMILIPIFSNLGV